VAFAACGLLAAAAALTLILTTRPR
jgi:hypothetical protein